MLCLHQTLSELKILSIPSKYTDKWSHTLRGELLKLWVNNTMKLSYKLRRCGPINQIVKDSDSKQSKFNHWFWSHSKSNYNIVLYCIISNLFLIKFDLISIKIDLISIKINLISIKIDLISIKLTLFRLKLT